MLITRASISHYARINGQESLRAVVNVSSNLLEKRFMIILTKEELSFYPEYSTVIY